MQIMNGFSHFKNARKKGIIKGCFYSSIVIALVYLLFTPALAFLILPDNSELILQPNQHSNGKLDLFVNLFRSFLIILGMMGFFRVWLILKYQCREYQILANYFVKLLNLTTKKEDNAIKKSLDNLSYLSKLVSTVL